jgi:hypothetical protein
MIIGLYFYVVQHVFELLGKLNYYSLLLFFCISTVYCIYMYLYESTLCAN